MQFHPHINPIRAFAEDELTGSALTGYAARAAARELIASWEDALADGNMSNLVGDVDDVICRLQAFKNKALEQLPFANGGLAGQPVAHWRERLADAGVSVLELEPNRTRWTFTGARLVGRPEGYLYVRDAVVEAVMVHLPEGGYALTPRQMAKARAHELAREVDGTGWCLLADRNVFGDLVHLVSKHRDRTLALRCDKPYHDFLRQCAKAEAYAHDHKETPLLTGAPPAELVVRPLRMN